MRIDGFGLGEIVLLLVGAAAGYYFVAHLRRTGKAA